MYFCDRGLIGKLDFRSTGDINKWDEQILACGYPSPFQSTAYGEYLKFQGDTIRYLDIFNGAQKIGHCLLSINSKNVAQCLYGPIIKEGISIEYKEIVSAFLNYLKKLKIIYMPLLTTQLFFPDQDGKKDYGLCSEIYDSPIVDLRKPFQEIYGSFDHSVRKNFKKCETAGVEVSITNEAGSFDHYLKMLSAYRKKAGLAMPPFYPNKTSVRCFNRKNTSIEVALARIGDEYVAGLGYVSFGKMLVEVGVAQNDMYQQVKLPVHDFIKVKAMQYYAKKGIFYYDITAVKRFPETSKEHNIKRFKLKFSPMLAEFAAIRNVFFRYPAYFGYKAINKIEALLTKAKI